MKGLPVWVLANKRRPEFVFGIHPALWLSVILLLVLAAPVRSAQVAWGAAESNGVGLADGTDLPVGDLVRIGRFDISDTQISANATDVAYLNSHFIEFAHAAIGDGNVNGDGEKYPAHWLANSNVSSNSLGLANTGIYYWIFDAATIDAATQIGIFTAPADSDWKFPDDNQIPDTTTTDISDVPHDSSGVLVGGYGTGTSDLSGAPLYNLAPIASSSPTPSPTPDSHLANISTRLSVQTADNVLIAGFIVQGSGAKKVMIRGLGPSLPVTGALADPTLELHDNSGDVLAANDDWATSANEQEIAESGIAPTNSKESAILISVAPGSYTAILSGKNDTTGVGLVEVYDLDQNAAAAIVNISTRGFVQTDDNVMIGGVIVTGADNSRVIIRAIGPSLPVSNNLADPVLELHGSNGQLITSNDNWRDTQEKDIEDTGVAPTNDKESAIVITLAPGSYTAIVKGANNTTGVGLVEVYRLTP
jgi:hypothetical protein